VLLSRSMVLYDLAQQRWRLHDLMRDLACGHAAAKILDGPADPARLNAACKRHSEHYCTVLSTANDRYLNR
jgi:hypothetical protein